MIKTEKVMSEFFEGLNPLNVLDLGCGKGRASLGSAKKGANVVGVDRAVQDIKADNFKFINEKIENFKFNNKYDLIIASLVLHFFKEDEALGIIEKVKNSTNSGGYNFIACLTDKDSFYKKGNFYPGLDELKKIYSDWKIVNSVQDYTPVEEHNNLGPHRHNIAFILAKKI